MNRRSLEQEQSAQWFDDYVEELDKKYEEKFRNKKERILKGITAILGMLKKRGSFLDTQNSNYIKRRIIPYVERNRWLPDSYNDMLQASKKGKTRLPEIYSHNYMQKEGKQ